MFRRLAIYINNKLAFLSEIIGNVIANVFCDRIQEQIGIIKQDITTYANEVSISFSRNVNRIISDITRQITENLTIVFSEKFEKKIKKDFFHISMLSNNVQSSRKTDVIRIVFIFQSASLWNSWNSLWKAFQNDQRFKTYMVVAPFLSHPLVELSFYDKAKNFLLEKGVPFFTGESFSPDSLKPHVVFFQTPYNDSLPEHLRFKKFTESGALIAYVPYGLDIGGAALNLNSQFNSSLHQNAWRIFVRSDRHKRMFAKYCRSGNGHVVVSGHPKIDMLKDLQTTNIDQDLRDSASGRRVVLWCPHFSVGEPPAWSTFTDHVDDILSEFEKREKLFLLVRPHPLLFNTLQKKSIWSKDQEKSFRYRIEKVKNISLDEQVDYRISFAIADALMTDAGSFMLEFFATGKPLLYLQTIDGYGLNDDADILEYIYEAKTTSEIINFLDMVQKKEDFKRAERLKAIPQFLFGLDGRNGERIRDHIFEAIAAGDIGAPNPITVSEKHQVATKYWEVSSNTYLAEPHFYEIQEKSLHQFLEPFAPFRRTIDIGCGDGRFTFILKDYSEFVKAIDVSPALIEKAIQTASMRSDFKNFEFIIESLENPVSCGTYDLVSCMGVTSGFIDNTVFLNAVDMICAMMLPNALLLLKETLSLTDDRIVEMNGYIARYRYIEAYLDVFRARELELVRDLQLAKDDNKNLVNKLILFRKT